MDTATPTGLEPDAFRSLSEKRQRRLTRWHASVSGSDDGRPWWPLAIRRMSLAERLECAEDPVYAQHWTHLERLRVEADPAYFVEGYGHVRAAVAGAPPIPFQLWDLVEGAAELATGARCQRETLQRFVEEKIVVVLKARQLGQTWLALHYALWLMSFNPATPRAKVLALSKKEDDATELLKRLRKINQLLPPFLRKPEDRETRGSLSRFKLQGRGDVRSLVSNPDAARSEQADLFLWDEAAFTRNKNFEDTWTAAVPTLGDEGRAIIISTGNGPAEVAGDGQGFAKLLGQALVGEDGMLGVFLPDTIHPDRSDPDWRERERRKFISEEAFQAEHPLSIEEALQGKQGDKVYPLGGIAAAVRLGAELDELLAAGELELPTGGSEGTIAPGIDWGTYSHLLTIWELPSGGIYVPPGGVASFAEEVTDKMTQYLEGVKVHVQEPMSRAPDGQPLPLRPLLREARYDSAGVEQMRTVLAFVEASRPLLRSWETVMTSSAARPVRVRTLAVSFSKYKQETIEYLRWLFVRSVQAEKPGGERWGYIAISPTNKDLLRQLRGLEYEDDGSGRVKKHDDHGPDALIAGAAPVAAENRGRVGPTADAEPQPA